MKSQTNQAASLEGAAPLRALCIARHCFLSEHIARYFAQMGVTTSDAVGLDCAGEVARDVSPDVVICDFDLLASMPLEKWEEHELLSNTPVVAVSLTRQVQQLQLRSLNGIAGFLYLPTLEQEPALRVLRAAATRVRYTLPSSGLESRAIERS